MVGSRISVAVILYHNIFQCLLGQSLLNILKNSTLQERNTSMQTFISSFAERNLRYMWNSCRSSLYIYPMMKLYEVSHLARTQAG